MELSDRLRVILAEFGYQVRVLELCDAVQPELGTQYGILLAAPPGGTVHIN